jgi:hypothetical protein
VKNRVGREAVWRYEAADKDEDKRPPKGVRYIGGKRAGNS